MDTTRTNPQQRSQKSAANGTIDWNQRQASDRLDNRLEETKREKEERVVLLEELITETPQEEPKSRRSEEHAQLQLARSPRTWIGLILGWVVFWLMLMLVLAQWVGWASLAVLTVLINGVLIYAVISQRNNSMKHERNEHAN